MRGWLFTLAAMSVLSFWIGSYVGYAKGWNTGIDAAFNPAVANKRLENLLKICVTHPPGARDDE